MSESVYMQWHMIHVPLIHNLRLAGKSEDEIDLFLIRVEKLLGLFVDSYDDERKVFTHYLFWAGEDIADEAARIIVSEVKAAYPEHVSRICTNPYMEPDVVLVVDMVTAGKEMIGEQV